MKRLLIIAVTAAVLAVSAVSPVAGRGPRLPNGPANNRQTDNYETRLSTKQDDMRAKALEKVLTGKARPRGDNKVVKIAPGQFVELGRQDEDSIWTVLGEFSDLPSNSIPQPDRDVDNTTIWEPDFSRDYYRGLLFDEGPGVNSLRQYYIEQSSGAYAVNGDVTDWNTVPQTGAYYGSNEKSDAYAWLFVRDSVNAWYNARVADGWTASDFNEYLSRFDQWDRYDNDGDGNFNEPDGYIDHFQSIHSGEGEEAGGGTLGDDAIWSHRWYAFYNNIGTTGPSKDYLLGGIKIGGTNFWIGDYTIEPENGGVGVFAHEYAHDLGLPDEYDTSGNAGGAENGTGWWTLMSQGSWATQNDTDIGSSPTHMSAWDKLQLGWLNYEVALPGDDPVSTKLGPAEHRTKQAQAFIVVLPDRQHEIDVGAPYAGETFYYSGATNDLDTTMTRTFALPSGTVSLSAKVRYDIEVGWDYAYLTVNGDPVDTNLSTDSDPNDQNFGNGITGSTEGAWVNLTADLSAYAGQTVDLGFRYWTDSYVQGNDDSADGIAIDNIEVTGSALDGAETDTGWTYESNNDLYGFHRTNGQDVASSFNFYVAENRQYWGYDVGLRKGPYNFGFLDDANLQNWVEHFPYQDGMLVWYADYFWSDNNVGDHPGEGLILPIDSKPAILNWDDDGSVMRPRIQSFDATFTREPTDRITLHKNSNPTTIPSRPGVSVFNDMNDYYVASDPGDSKGHYQAGWNSVDNPNTGTVIRIKSVTPGGMMQIQVTPPQP